MSIVLGFVDVDLDRARSATGSAVFLTDTVLVLVSLDGVPHDGVGAPTDVQVRYLADVAGIAVTGYNDGWAPTERQEQPTGQYRLSFTDGSHVAVPPTRGTTTKELRDFIVSLTRRG